MSNEAAERVRNALTVDGWKDTDLDLALAAERRATVERIRAAMRDNGGFEGENLDAILDEVAAR